MADKTWLGGITTIGYDSGSDEPTAGDIITGTTSGAYGTYVSSTVTGGSWVGNDAAGVLTLRTIEGVFIDDEVLINTTQADNDIANIDSTTTPLDESNAGDFDTAANWSPSGVPASSDDIFVNALAETVPSTFAATTTQTIGKKFSIDDGLDQSAKDFASITVLTGYDGNIGYITGVTYSPFLCACDSVIFGGSGSFYLAAKHATNPIDKVTNNSSNGSLFLGKASTDGQEITQVIHTGSSTEVLAAQTGVLAAPEVDEVICTSRQGSITIAEDNSSATLKISAILGTVTAYCSIADAEIAGGTLKWGKSDFEPAAARTITLLTLLLGNVIWDMAGTVSECYCFAGKFSLSGSGVKVIGDSTKNAGTIEIYEAQVDFSAAENNFSLAADSEFRKFGGSGSSSSGKLELPSNMDITIA